MLYNVNVGFYCTAKWISYIYSYIPLLGVSFPFRSSQSTELSSLSYTVSSNSVQFCRSVVSKSLWLHELQHARPPCPSPTPRVYPNSCPLSQWCRPTVSSFVIPFSSHLQSFPASGSFQMSQFFASGGQSIAVSASTSVLPMNTQDWSPLGWTGWTRSLGSWNLALCPLSSEWTGSGAACEIQCHVQLSGSTWVRGYLQTCW